jgi:hypothetical protein
MIISLSTSDPSGHPARLPIVLFLLERLRAVAASIPLLSRSLFLAEMLAGISSSFGLSGLGL